MRIQEDRSRQKNILIEVIAESPKENWKDTEKNYIRCCTTTLTSQKEWLMKGRTELKSERLRQGPRTIVAKLLNYKDKGHILKNTHHLKDTNIYIYKDFSKKQWQYVSHYGTRLRNYDSKERMLSLNMTRFTRFNSAHGDKCVFPFLCFPRQQV